MTIACYHLGLIGYPLGHSRSPQLHQAALANAKLAGEYCLYPVPPTQEGAAEIERIIENLCQGNLHGLNVTIPHKQTVMPYLDQHSLVARAVGAVNTLYLNGDGRVAGDNTDVPGFLWDVHRLVRVDSGAALVLGAGGSARAVVYALAQAGWQVRVLARRAAQAFELAADLAGTTGLSERLAAGLLDRSTLARASAGCDLLVNTTPVGMFPDRNGCPWPEDLPLPPSAAVYDLIYNPPETRLVQRARAEGLPATGGAGMLIAQAALSFSRWTGLEPPFAVMENAFYGDAL